MLPPSLLLLLRKGRSQMSPPLPSDWLLLTALLMQSSTDGRFARLNSTLAALQALFGSSSPSAPPSSSPRSLEKTALLVEILASFAFLSLVHFWLWNFCHSHISEQKTGQFKESNIAAAQQACWPCSEMSSFSSTSLSSSCGRPPNFSWCSCSYLSGTFIADPCTRLISDDPHFIAHALLLWGKTTWHALHFPPTDWGVPVQGQPEAHCDLVRQKNLNMIVQSYSRVQEAKKDDCS